MLNVAIEKARENPVHKYQFCAIITTKRSRIVSIGYNSFSKTHTLQAHYSRKHNKKDACFLHAEISAILKAKGKGSVLYVARVRKDNTAALARPCPACMAAIRQETNLKKVIYTINDQEYGVINLQ